VLSETDGCKWNVVVQIVGAGRAPHRVLARTRTNSRGVWQFDRSFERPVRARVPGRFIAGVGYCPGARTPRLQR
jgi:hypothetical protein